MELFKKYLDRTGMDHKQYQYDGVAWCVKNETCVNPPCNVRGGFIADEMGLGKTIMMIGTFLCNFVPNTLIIVPPILIDQWYTQILRTTGHKALIYHGADKKTITLYQLSRATIVISTYGAITLTKKQVKDDFITPLHKVNWSRIVFDEAHHLRNRKTALYISATLLKSNIRWLVSGTPVQNKKQDFYSLCSAIKIPTSFYTDSANLPTLARAFILKRTKTQVGIQMAPIVVGNNIVNWQNKKEMELSEELHSALAFSHVSGNKGNKLMVNTFSEGGILALMLRTRQSCILPKLMAPYLDKLVALGFLNNYDSYQEAFDHSSKLDSVVQSILERKGNGCGKIIFCQFKEEIDTIAAKLRAGGMDSVVTFDGRTSATKRFTILREKNEALILQIQTGCEGLNLQENYSEIYFVSPHWNPAVEDQAVARCHRIGQLKPVMVQKFEMCNFVSDDDQQIHTKTMDTYISNVQEKKRYIAIECMENIHNN